MVFDNAATASLATLEQVTEGQLDQTSAVNVRGTLFTVQKALPLLNDGASVILNASTAAGNGAETFGVSAASGSTPSRRARSTPRGHGPVR